MLVLHQEMIYKKILDGDNNTNYYKISITKALSPNFALILSLGFVVSNESDTESHYDKQNESRHNSGGRLGSCRVNLNKKYNFSDVNQE